MSSDAKFTTTAVVASTAAVSCALTALAAWHLIPKCVERQQHSSREHHRHLDTPEPGLTHNHDPLFSPINSRKRLDPYDVRPRNDYLSWDDYFMAVAFLSAERSKDPNKQVGACIVNEDNIILSIGYNGFPRGCPDRKLPWAKKAASGSILDTKYPYVVHAEANALLNKNQAQVAGARIYVTLFPCNECAKLLIQAGIKEVVYHEAKLEPTGKRPATMEQAAAADIAEDDGTAANCNSNNCHGRFTGQNSTLGEQQRQSANAHHIQKEQKFSVGASSDVDASYVASQRLLTMAGVKLRQHALKRTVQLPPGGAR